MSMAGDHQRQRQRGIILLVAMLTAVALAFAGMSLVRAVSTAVAIGANLDARQYATLAASAAFEQDVAALFGSSPIVPTADDLPHHYFASRQPGEDARGVPGVLQSMPAYPAALAVLDAGNGYAARHVIERLCLLPGEASSVNCTLSPPSVAAAAGTPPSDEPPRLPYYRITVRVDGPAATATFVQGTVSGAHANPRLSWRVLDE
jgi:type IV pilus assembly protein PilX